MALFGFWRKEKTVAPHLVMDREANVIAKAEIQSQSDEKVQLKIVEGDADRVARAEIIQVVPKDNQQQGIVGKVTFRRGNVIEMEPTREAGAQVRKNFRMPADFESFIYPPSGGRYIIKAIDLSCGGIAFYSIADLKPGDKVEVVIPITAEGPLIVQCLILRSFPQAPPIQKYACQFVDMIPDEEAMIQEAVFGIQLRTIQNNARAGRR